MKKDWPFYALTLLLAALPACVYLAAPDFYLRYVLNDQMREYQAVEMVTFSTALVGGLLLAIGARRLWRVRPGPDYGPEGLRGVPDRWGAVSLVGASALAALFLAGEEVNWGQTFLHWGVAERQQQRDITLNLHNTTDAVSIQSLGSWYVLITFLLIPVVWAFRRPLNLPDAWRAAVPILPATVAVLLGLGLSEVKDIAEGLRPQPIADDDHYVRFFEQLNEQKEMLIGTAMLLYGVGVLRQTKAADSGTTAESPPDAASTA